MKHHRLILTLAGILLCCAAFGQRPPVAAGAAERTEVFIPRFKLFPTTNMWIFLKLDTSNGKVWMVQYGMEEKDRLEAPVNLLPLVYSRDPTPGRFTLYPTETMWTFILLDQTDGRTWQVQWSLDGKEGLVPINALPTY